jgi:hypothetical protein
MQKKIAERNRAKTFCLTKSLINIINFLFINLKLLSKYYEFFVDVKSEGYIKYRQKIL